MTTSGKEQGLTSIHNPPQTCGGDLVAHQIASSAIYCRHCEYMYGNDFTKAGIGISFNLKIINYNYISFTN